MLSSLAAALVAATPDAILIADEDGHYIEANPAALALLGYTRSEPPEMGLSRSDRQRAREHRSRGVEFLLHRTTTL